MKSEESKDCDVHEDDGIEMFNATGDVESSYEDLLRMLYLFNQMDKYDSNLSKEMKKQKKIKKKMDKNGFLNFKGNKSNTIDIKQVNE